MAAPGLVTDCLEQRSSGLVFVFYKYWGQRDQGIAIELKLFWSFPTGTLENKTIIEPVNRQQGGSVFIVSPSSSPYPNPPLLWRLTQRIVKRRKGEKTLGLSIPETWTLMDRMRLSWAVQHVTAAPQTCYFIKSVLVDNCSGGLCATAQWEARLRSFSSRSVLSRWDGSAFLSGTIWVRNGR